MLVNLLDNAVKFTPHNGQIGLEIRRDDAQEVVVFTVWDTGLGITKSDTELLFRPFFQLEQGLKKQFGGAGLGLSLVKRLAEMHGGTATVESTQGKGSRFSVSIPDARSSNKAPSSRPMPLSVRRFTPRRISESAPLMMGPPVLVVDDNEINANMLRDVLSLNRFRVIVARSGREALELLALESISAVLMDVQMPDMDGLEAIQIIRSDERFAKLPIVAITALAMTGDRERCLAAGANEYIAKPVSLKHVVTMLHRLIQS
jgi:CheY-like chemotaxis protein